MNLTDVQKQVNKFLREHHVRGNMGRIVGCPPLGTVRRWAAEDLMSGPTGTPQNPVYPPWVWAEIITVRVLMERGLSRKQIRQGRLLMVACIQANKSVVEELARLYKENEALYSFAFVWIATALKVASNASPDKPAKIEEFRTATGFGWKVGAERKKKRTGQDATVVDRIVRAGENDRPSV